MPDTFQWVGTADSTTETVNGGWNVEGNWIKNGAVSTTLPAAGDTVFFTESAQGILVGPNTDNTTIVYLAALHFDQSWTGFGPSAGLNIGAALMTVGQHYGSGSPSGSTRIRVNLTPAPLSTNASHSTEVVVYDSSTSAEDTFAEPVRLVADNVLSTIEVRKGIVGVASSFAGETASFNTLDASFVSNVLTDAQVNVSPGVTLNAFKQTGGANTVQASSVTTEVQAGTLTYRGAGAVTLMTVGADGSVFAETSGTIAAIVNRGTVDMTRDAAARTVSRVDLHAGSTFRYDKANVTITTATGNTGNINLIQCGLEDVTLEAGQDLIVRTV